MTVSWLVRPCNSCQTTPSVSIHRPNPSTRMASQLSRKKTQKRRRRGRRRSLLSRHQPGLSTSKMFKRQSRRSMTQHSELKSSTYSRNSCGRSMNNLPASRMRLGSERIRKKKIVSRQKPRPQLRRKRRSEYIRRVEPAIAPPPSPFSLYYKQIISSCL